MPAYNQAAGHLIAIFDAEDIPERTQLRKAAAAFASADKTLACVQARLGAYNPRESWISRQYTVEYAALFEAILPTLERIRFPIPLGGTSNHFRRACLIDVGAWDPYNLTEDADLGLRLARRGYRVSMLDATTWEEAPASWSVWLGQRTRWIKGWTQTYLVHMRHPRRLWRDLGPWGFLGVQVTLAASILSALVHPWFYVAIAASAVAGESMLPLRDPLWQASLFVLVSGYVTGVALSLSALWHPIYWLAISFAAYRAMIDLMLRPYYWEKTPHRGAAVTRGRDRRAGRSI